MSLLLLEFPGGPAFEGLPALIGGTSGSGDDTGQRKQLQTSVHQDSTIQQVLAEDMGIRQIFQYRGAMRSYLCLAKYRWSCESKAYRPRADTSQVGP